MQAEWDLRRSRNRLREYRPYSKQAEFHAAGATFRERLLMAGNQLGKSVAGAAEVSMHLTGLYPDWWCGRRFDRPTHGWAASDTGETTRDNVQAQLIGPPATRELWGTGFIPVDRLISTKPGMGTPNLLDNAVVGMSRAASARSASRRIARAARSGRGRRRIGFGSMRSHRWTSTPRG